MAIQIQSRLQTQRTLHGVEHGYRAWEAYSRRTLAKMETSLEDYEPTSLDEMGSVALLNRTDTKYILHLDQLAQTLTQISDHYKVLEISQRRVHAYQNLYFDTPDFFLYDQHHRGMRDRFKVRCRYYSDSSLSYLEIKRKNNCDRTIKSRQNTPAFIEELTEAHEPFLKSSYPYEFQTLSPVLWVEFRRITLVSRSAIERLTLDFNLGFSDGWQQVGLPGLAIAEVKQDGFSINSEFMRRMRSLRIPMQRFSKYCMGIPMFYPEVKANRFKRRVLLVERIINKGT